MTNMESKLIEILQPLVAGELPAQNSAGICRHAIHSLDQVCVEDSHAVGAGMLLLHEAFGALCGHEWFPVGGFFEYNGIDNLWSGVHGEARRALAKGVIHWLQHGCDHPDNANLHAPGTPMLRVYAGVWEFNRPSAN